MKPTDQLSDPEINKLPYRTRWHSPHSRFWSRVINGSKGCWNWSGRKNRQGYGQFNPHINQVLAHRYAYEDIIGAIPEGLTIDHLCKNRACVNPFHLEPVTLKENLKRGTSPASINRKKKHCNRGHKLYGDNLLVISTTGFRKCRECSRINGRKTDKKRRAQRAGFKAETI